jgi:hypothetical protein
MSHDEVPSFAAPRRTRARVFAASGVLVMLVRGAIAGCGGDDTAGGGITGNDAGKDASGDALKPGADTSTNDGTSGGNEAGQDGSVTDSTTGDDGNDGNTGDDGNMGDDGNDGNTGDDAADADLGDTSDASVADTFVPDTFVPDTFVPDTGVADTNVSDTSVSDAGCGPIITFVVPDAGGIVAVPIDKKDAAPDFFSFQANVAWCTTPSTTVAPGVVFQYFCPLPATGSPTCTDDSVCGSAICGSDNKCHYQIVGQTGCLSSNGCTGNAVVGSPDSTNGPLYSETVETNGATTAITGASNCHDNSHNTYYWRVTAYDSNGTSAQAKTTFTTQ